MKMLKIRFKLPYLIWKDKVSNLLNPDQFAIWTFRPEIWIWTTPQDHITNKHAQCDKSDPPLSIRIRTQDSWQDDKITIITVCVTVSSLVSIGLYDGLTAWLNAEWQYDSLRSVKCGCDSMTVWQHVTSVGQESAFSGPLVSPGGDQQPAAAPPGEWGTKINPRSRHQLWFSGNIPLA